MLCPSRKSNRQNSASKAELEAVLKKWGGQQNVKNILYQHALLSGSKFSTTATLWIEGLECLVPSTTDTQEGWIWTAINKVILPLGCVVVGAVAGAATAGVGVAAGAACLAATYACDQAASSKANDSKNLDISELSPNDAHMSGFITKDDYNELVKLGKIDPDKMGADDEDEVIFKVNGEEVVNEDMDKGQYVAVNKTYRPIFNQFEFELWDYDYMGSNEQLWDDENGKPKIFDLDKMTQDKLDFSKSSGHGLVIVSQTENSAYVLYGTITKG